MNQYPHFLRLSHPPRMFLWGAILIIMDLVTLGNPVSWAAPVAHPPNQTIPPKHTTHLPVVVSPLINDCALSPYVCVLTENYTDATRYYDWSPDGHTLAFYAEGNGTPGLYTINEQGKDRRLLLALRYVGFIRYSPDGTMIALSAQRLSDRSINDLYVYTVATGEVRLLSDPGSVDFTYGYQAWSPDSSKLVFLRGSVLSSSIYTIPPDGSELTQLADIPSNEQINISWPTYSPDGKHILYEVLNNNTRQYSIEVMGSDGSNSTNLTSGVTDFAIQPFWGADNKSIFFRGSMNNATDIFKVNMDGSDVVNLTHNFREEYDFLLSPDGSQILFLAPADSDIYPGVVMAFYTINLDGSNVTVYPIPNGPGLPHSLKWHPDGNGITYVNYYPKSFGSEHLFLLRMGAGVH